MPERLYQLRFDKNLKPAIPQNVTPEGFAGLEFDKGQELGRFVREVAERFSIQAPNDVAQYLLTKVYVPFEDFDQEEMWVLLLDSKHQITHEVMVYRGQVGQISIREAELLKEAVKANAPALILSHCHPSRDPTPSPEDVRVPLRSTRQPICWVLTC
jgi:DNA repair protein RadC